MSWTIAMFFPGGRPSDPVEETTGIIVCVCVLFITVQCSKLSAIWPKLRIVNPSMNLADFIVRYVSAAKNSLVRMAFSTVDSQISKKSRQQMP